MMRFSLRLVSLFLVCLLFSPFSSLRFKGSHVQPLSTLQIHVIESDWRSCFIVAVFQVWCAPFLVQNQCIFRGGHVLK